MGTRSDTITKRQMEEIWARPGCEIMDALCSWDGLRGLRANPGTSRNPAPSAAALAFRRRWLTHDDFPAWSVLSRHMDIEPSAELKARYKADCPNNYKALIAAFGKTRTKYDAPIERSPPKYRTGRDYYTAAEYHAGAGSPLD